ncbi:pyrroline-5-carboxylate reductase [Amycolatopsis sp. WQ 127309]|uniref:pyrroline-5-carboxylate reductase n=1 Tax=Amycolatopsis sp. WQ 127309 TaxID=2932773 RepID=UPI001FF189D8|nr:pyrroline-5-carboxylate reductase [Amycolatopsis sp. WQ 127309]UOZ02957.1 pyrroline-5-carboxylate reductase [Amycolatopsis sp. WQ 127309]
MTTTIVGGGNMGEALLAGLLAGGATAEITVVEPAPARAEYLRSRYDVTVTSLAEAVPKAETLLITVKPYHFTALLDELASLVTPGQLIVSAVGGTPTSSIEARLPGEPVVVRSMPNLPVSVGAGTIAISAGRYAGAADLDRVKTLLAPLGRVVAVQESQLDTVTALSGGGPAYFALLAEAMIDAGVLAGLPRPLSAELVLATAAGSGRMLGEPDADPAQLRAAVCSPGGTTITAIQELESSAFRAAVMAAVVAARDRSLEMGR